MTTARVLATMLLLSPIACAGGRRDVIAPDAPLGRVVVYRNGVAYFERVATAQHGLTLSVPRERVDDFLKSLRVADAKSGEALPVSYRTTRATDDKWFQMHVEIPRGRHRVRLTYVTEAPAWKPSYRVVLGDDGKESRMQALAIVDNVSGESWRAVELGLGTTSALSFRYDLHSVQSVERDEIESAPKLGGAPPTGGSPYSTDGDKVRVLATLGANEAESAAAQQQALALAGTVAESRYTVQGASVSNPRFGTVSAGVVQEYVERVPISVERSYNVSVPTSGATSSPKPKVDPDPEPEPPFELLVAELAASHTRVRIEAQALSTDSDRREDPLRRANGIRESLVRRGIDRGRLEAVGLPELAETPASALRVVVIDDDKPTQARANEREGEPDGTAHFVLARPMTIGAGDSAMVTLFDEATQAERVYLYDPISARGSKRYAFTAVRLVNPSSNQLDTGPITVYADKRFLGEGMTEPIPAHGTAIVPYALDRSIVVESRESSVDDVESLRTVERGIATAQTRRVRKHELALVNRGKHDVRVFVRHRVPKGWTLKAPGEGVLRLGGDVLVPVEIEGGASRKLVLEESLPMATSLDLRAGTDLRALELHVGELPEDSVLRRELAAILAAHRKLRDLAAALGTRRGQAEELRVRIGELTGQLATLGKVGRPQGLSADLAKRARQLGTQYERAAAEIAELERERLTHAVELDNLVAELRLPP